MNKVILVCIIVACLALLVDSKGKDDSAKAKEREERRQCMRDYDRCKKMVKKQNKKDSGSSESNESEEEEASCKQVVERCKNISRTDPDPTSSEDSEEKIMKPNNQNMTNNDQGPNNQNRTSSTTSKPNSGPAPNSQNRNQNRNQNKGNNRPQMFDFEEPEAFNDY